MPIRVAAFPVAGLVLGTALLGPAAAGPADRVLAELESAGLQLDSGPAAVELHLADGRLLVGEWNYSGQDQGGQLNDRYVTTRYDVWLGASAPATASLELTSFPMQDVTLAALDYDGPQLAADRAIDIHLSLPGFARGLAIHRYQSCWTSPQWTSDFHTLTGQNDLLVWQRAGRLEYDMVAPLAGGGLIGAIGSRGGSFEVEMSGHCLSRPQHVPLFVFAFDLSPYDLTDKAYRLAFEHEHYYGRLRSDKPYPEAFTRLGWCSWNAYHQDVSEGKLLAAADSYSERGLPLGFVLLDDGWSIVRDGKLAGFGADPQKFPDGLAATVGRLHDDYRIHDVGVWHALQGYWGGIDPASRIGKGHRLVRVAAGLALPDPRASEPLFADWYAELARAGVDFVKIDNQGGEGRFTDGLVSRWDVVKSTQRSIQEAAVHEFSRGRGVGILNSMDLALEDVYNWHDSNVARTGNDYDPHDLLAAKDLVLDDVYNAYWIRNFAFPDYDMFQTDRPDALYQAIARAISGGPLYTSDAPGRENIPLLKRLMLPDGTLLRVDTPGVPTRDSLLTDPALTGTPLEVWSQVRRSGQVAGIVAAFNVDKAQTQEDGTIGPFVVDPLAASPQGARFAIFDMVAQKVMAVTGPDKSVAFWLPEYGADLFTIAPISAGSACLGLLDKLVGSAAIMVVTRPPGQIQATLAAKGDAGFYLDREPTKVVVEDHPLTEVQYTYRDHLLVI
ncbi:MAG: alpha-galactosidase, partial [Cyanobacteria bacterium REEB65]|nr:alpha-galactosidase [Cyanobacteria bacterium REEB65]